MSVDGTHCRIQEPRKEPNSLWYSHKSNKAAVCYEVGIDIDDNKIIHVSGPFHAGLSDLHIFRREGGLKEKIPPGKKVIADKIYQPEPMVSTTNPFDSPEVKRFKNRVRARQESLNKKAKDCNILETPFRHPLEKHKEVFEAIITMIQYDFDNGYSLFDV